VAAWHGFRADAGAAYDEVDYELMRLAPIENPDARRLEDPEHAKDIEGVIAHEFVHLRWRSLPHGLEFFARVRALLDGAIFPPRGKRPAETRSILSQKRGELRAWAERLHNRPDGG
jgi:hypothetical protein